LIKKYRTKNVIKAGTVLCPLCCIEYKEMIYNCEIDGFKINNVKVLHCPKCKNEVFTPEEKEKIMEKIRKI